MNHTFARSLANMRMQQIISLQLHIQKYENIFESQNNNRNIKLFFSHKTILNKLLRKLHPISTSGATKRQMTGNLKAKVYIPC